MGVCCPPGAWVIRVEHRGRKKEKKIKRNKTKTIFGSCDYTYYHERPVFMLTIRVRYFGPSAVLKLIFARDLLASDV
jgi:hypothetical protein